MGTFHAVRESDKYALLCIKQLEEKNRALSRKFQKRQISSAYGGVGISRKLGVGVKIYI